MQERDNPTKFGLFKIRILYGIVSSFLYFLISERKNPLFGFFEALPQLSCFLLLFPFVFLNFLM